MIAALLCLAGLLAAYFGARRSPGIGLLSALAVGYGYGILRANLNSLAAHFLFDAAIAGFYAGWLSRNEPGDARTRAVRVWTAVLIIWPLLVCLLPFQPILISLVGLRGNAYLLPCLVAGAMLNARDLERLAFGIAGLNCLALAVAAAQYVVGIERFFPLNALTTVIYGSRDVAGGLFVRIPSTFANAHAYGGAMVLTLPFLFGAWTEEVRLARRFWLLCGLAAGLLGVLLSTARIAVVTTGVLVMVATFALKLRLRTQVTWCLAIAAIVAAVISNERLQRFTSLADTDAVGERVSGSVNSGFWEILMEFPMGNGLGGGGTSIPHFLQSQLNRPVAMESEYARILLEQGLIGLALWLLFILWFAAQYPVAVAPGPWSNGRRLAWWACMCQFALAMIGIGMLTAIPASALFLVCAGWAVTTPARPEPLKEAPDSYLPAAVCR